SRKSPNRKVGDHSLQPTRAAAAFSQIPQPEGWGSFTPAYKQTAGPRAAIPQPEEPSKIAKSADVNDPQPSGWGIAGSR
ncbi:MAG: hypothetical protein AABN34_17035, partial [Acidobacteriota bacterium]